MYVQPKKLSHSELFIFSHFSLAKLRNVFLVDESEKLLAVLRSRNDRSHLFKLALFRTIAHSLAITKPHTDEWKGWCYSNLVSFFSEARSLINAAYKHRLSILLKWFPTVEERTCFSGHKVERDRLETSLNST